MKVIKISMGPVPNKHIPLHLENMICRPGHRCSMTILNFKLVCCDHFILISQIAAPLIRILQVAINCSVLLIGWILI